MTVSALAVGSIPHHKKFNTRDGTTITRVIPHHWAGTSGGDVTLADPKREASANYLIFTDGTIKSQVPEEYRAWTTGSWAVDACSITVEIQNSTNGPEWRVSDKAIAALVNLIADIARRYKWGSVPAWRVRGHREFVATACPGPYLFPKLGNIAASADAKLKAPAKPSKPAGQEEEDDMIYIRKSAKDKVYAWSPQRGTKRHVGTTEWNAIKRAYGAAGLKLPLIDTTAAETKHFGI